MITLGRYSQGINHTGLMVGSSLINKIPHINVGFVYHKYRGSCTSSRPYWGLSAQFLKNSIENDQMLHLKLFVTPARNNLNLAISRKLRINQSISIGALSPVLSRNQLQLSGGMQSHTYYILSERFSLNLILGYDYAFRHGKNEAAHSFSAITGISFRM